MKTALRSTLRPDEMVLASRLQNHIFPLLLASTIQLGRLMRLAFALCAALALASSGGAQSDTSRARFRLTAPLQQTSEDSKMSSYAIKGALIGGVTGLLVDAARDYMHGTPASCIPGACVPEDARISPPFGTGILVGAAAGFAIGAVVGWQHDSRVAVIPDSNNGRTGLAARIAW